MVDVSAGSPGIDPSIAVENRSPYNFHHKSFFLDTHSRFKALLIRFNESFQVRYRVFEILDGGVLIY
jgi:hypothetical protein